jgi:hypothetical protein
MPTEKEVTPRIWAENGWIHCKVPFDSKISPAFVVELKNEINWKFRQYRKADNSWLVDPSCLEDLVRIARKYFPKIHVIGGREWTDPPDPSPETGRKSRQDAPKSRRIVQETGTYQVIAELLRSASIDTLKRVYRALAADFHPDRGGDEDMLRRLNVAWDKIQQERGRGVR